MAWTRRLGPQLYAPKPENFGELCWHLTTVASSGERGCRNTMTERCIPHTLSSAFDAISAEIGATAEIRTSRETTP